MAATAAALASGLACVGRPQLAVEVQPPFRSSSPRDRPPVAQSAARERDAAATIAGDDEVAAQVQVSLAALLAFVLTGGAAPILANVVGFFDEDRLFGARGTDRRPREKPAAEAPRPARCAAFLCGPVRGPR
jgi:hypothetical protein